ncbi:MAG: hypothetical protein AMXMBFR46_13730 [Acidimicrobiia bacterium]
MSAGFPPPSSPPAKAAASTGALVVTGLALAAGAAIPRLPAPLRLPANLLTATGSLAVAALGGVDRGGTGFERGRVRRGLAHGGAAAAAVALGVGAAAGHPRTRGLFADHRVARVTRARVVYEVLVRIPFETVLAEEILFRGAVLGAWQHAVGTAGAVAVSSTVFGVWHVLPALESHAHNPASAQLSARAGGRAAHVGGTVVATTAAGVMFAVLRLRARSVLAPIVAHAAMNQLAYLAARRAHPRAHPAEPPARPAPIAQP